MARTLDALDQARDAAARDAWLEAYTSYRSASARIESGRDLELFGESAWWSGKLDEAIDARERAHAAYVREGDRLGAARVALNLAWDQVGRAAFAVAQGWLATAERLLAEEEPAREHGLLLLTRGAMTLFTGEGLEGAIAELDRAHELAGRFGDRETQVMSLAGKGRALVQLGRVEEGLRLQDEAAAVCGGLGAHATGLVYCITISTCQDVGDFRRAAEWSEAAKRWCNRLDVTGFPGACRVHHAEIIRLRGDWPQAEEQALAACAELQDFDRYITGSGYYEVGEIRRRRGEYAAAEEAYRTANEWGRSPQPGLALLRLAEGKVEAAAAGIAHALAETQDPLARLKLLPARVEIALAAGDLATARGALEELERLVDAFRIGERRAPAFDAAVSLARGRIHLAERDWAGAAACFRRGRDDWQHVGAPYEIAQARLLLGTAHRRQGDEHAAAVELEAALDAFERLGARPEADRAAELLGRLEARRTFLFTDIVDSTRLLGTLGEAKWRRLLSRHDELVREQIAEHGGKVVKQTGDGFFASFETPKAAIDAAVGIERALDGEIVAPDVRIGVHAGTAFSTGTDEGDFGGEGVHAAARIAALGGKGEIVVSRETLDGVSLAVRVSEP
ncbi:MAG TPA: adenylate/guanylate cyclase domain-containing protein, partial [Gaiellaceae bacterium]|nr:adenylate/guanylate cyclase domain-containing protein [Gaiellaceae bacterium]